MAIVNIDKVCCKGCDICIAVCPKKIFVKSKKRNAYGTNMPDFQNTQDCILCRLCEKMCPDGAIDIEPEAEKNED